MNLQVCRTVLLLFILQFVVVSSKIVRTCQDENLNIRCENGNVISIIGAMYGRTSKTICNMTNYDTNTKCISPYSKQVVRKLCHNLPECTINAGIIQFYEDPCKNTYKYLEVNYVCINVGIKKIACKDENLKISCKNNTVINIAYAMYGRQDLNTCNKTAQHFDIHCFSQNSTDIVRQMCQYLPECTVNVGNNQFNDDPCSGCDKYLQVNYECVEIGTQVGVCQNTDLPISCGNNQMIDIAYAMFGRQNSTYCNTSNGYDTFTDCAYSNSTDIVRENCQYQYGCNINANIQQFGSDLCKYTYKYLTVNYECIDDDAKVAVCQDKNFVINCPAGTYINIAYAMYGRRNPNICPVYNLDPNTDCYSENSIDISRRMCQFLPTCIINAGDNQFDGNPCGDILYKYLEVNYYCLENQIEFICDENEILTPIPMGNNVIGLNCVCKKGYQADIWNGTCIQKIIP